MDKTYQLKEMDHDKMRSLLVERLWELSQMEVEDLTTFELHFLHAFSTNPPNRRKGVEERIN